MNNAVNGAVEIAYFGQLHSSRQVDRPEESVEIVNRRDLLRRRTRISTSGPELAAAVVDELIAQVAGGR